MNLRSDEISFLIKTNRCKTPFKTPKMAEEKRIRLAVIHEILPKEMFVRVLRFLDFKTISIARKTCKEWKRIIDLFNLSKDASRKFLIENLKMYLY